MFPTNCTVHGVNTKYHLHRQSANLSCFQKKCILCCHQYVTEFFTFIGPCIIIYSYSTTNNMNLFLKLFSLVKRSTCFGRSSQPSSGARNCTYGNRHMSNSCCYLLLVGMKWNTFQHVERFTRINNLRNRRILLVVL